jgi:hypothetical protein
MIIDNVTLYLFGISAVILYAVYFATKEDRKTTKKGKK